MVGNKQENIKRVVQKSPQEMARLYEKEVNELIEESSILLRKGEMFNALQKALRALKKDKILTEHRKSFSLSIQQGQRLTFATWFHLAVVYEGNKKYDKAIETYDFLMKEKQFIDFPLQVRVNIGNLFFIQGKYPQAIRMYRMALDQTLHEDQDTRLKINRNIGNSFIKLGKLRDAILSYEDSVATNFDVKSFLNLISCYVELNDDEKSKEALFRMINGCTKILDTTQEIEEERRSNFDTCSHLGNSHKDTDSMLHTASRLVANMKQDQNWVDNFAWVHEQLYHKFPDIAFQIEIERAVEHLQRGDYVAAVKIFKSYEGQQEKYKTMVSINLSFFYFLEGNYKTSSEYADIAISTSKYNPYALVNKGNCFFISEDYSKAREFYLEAIAIQSTCFEAIYNMALTSVRLGHTLEAIQSFSKLHSVSANDPRVLYQVSNLYEEVDDTIKAEKWFNILLVTIPSDPGILTRLGQLFLLTNNESQSFHYHLESFRCFPSDIDVIGWLAIWFVKHDMIEKSIPFLLRASRIQPDEVKWKIMVATGYRKLGKDLKALTLYKKILKMSPRNEECK
jgi:intraflagellar transport protein 88